jgi:hypothetical protein
MRLIELALFEQRPKGFGLTTALREVLQTVANPVSEKSLKRLQINEIAD